MNRIKHMTMKQKKVVNAERKMYTIAKYMLLDEDLAIQISQEEWIKAFDKIERDINNSDLEDMILSNLLDTCLYELTNNELLKKKELAKEPVLQALSQLEGRTRATIVLRDIAKLSCEDIARVMTCDLSEVAATLTLGRCKLKSAFQKNRVSIVD
jgi:DNA-directed RNA polymerase specialized sigma24 family protein